MAKNPAVAATTGSTCTSQLSVFYYHRRPHSNTKNNSLVDVHGKSIWELFLLPNQTEFLVRRPSECSSLPATYGNRQQSSGFHSPFMHIWSHISLLEWYSIAFSMINTTMSAQHPCHIRSMHPPCKVSTLVLTIFHSIMIYPLLFFFSPWFLLTTY